jgi:hypothetical protein
MGIAALGVCLNVQEEFIWFSREFLGKEVWLPMGCSYMSSSSSSRIAVLQWARQDVYD